VQKCQNADTFVSESGEMALVGIPSVMLLDEFLCGAPCWPRCRTDQVVIGATSVAPGYPELQGDASPRFSACC
jgi:hypothetical protein